MPGVLELSFDPLVSIGGATLRLDAVALVVVLFLAVALWVLRLHAALGAAFRFEDTCFVLLGTIPGAVVGGRLVHVLDFAGTYLAQPATMLDLGHGSASLVGAIIGGSLSAAYVCRLLGGRIAVWADAASVPMLVVIGLGKVALLLGGGGRGASTDGPLGVYYAGPGPWRPTDIEVPAWPSQAMEGIWALLGIPVLLVLERSGRLRSRAGRGISLLIALAWWLAGRTVIALTWRDDRLLGPLGAEATATLAALGLVLVALVLAWRDTPPVTVPHQTVPEGPGPTGTGSP